MARIKKLISAGRLHRHKTNENWLLWLRDKWQFVKPFLKKNVFLPFLGEKCKQISIKSRKMFNYVIFYMPSIKNVRFVTFFDNF